MTFAPFTLKVPASTANLGPGFDSIGLALNRFLYVQVSQAEKWKIISHDNLPFPKNIEDNLFYKAAKIVADYRNTVLPPLQLDVKSDIPLSRGLGSSAAAIVAGVEMANIVLQVQLSEQEKIQLTSDMEGHPDNTTASLLGGLTISTYTPEHTYTLTHQIAQVDIITLVPKFELETSLSRSVLPASFSFKESVQASSIANVLVAALLKGNWSVVGNVMEQDLFHQPYRKTLVPDLDDIISFAKHIGAYGTALSGAGPTVISFVPFGQGENIVAALKSRYPQYYCELTQPVADGVKVLANQII